MKKSFLFLTIVCASLSATQANAYTGACNKAFSALFESVPLGKALISAHCPGGLDEVIAEQPNRIDTRGCWIAPRGDLSYPGPDGCTVTLEVTYTKSFTGL